jgi:hypothetical protein
MLDGALNKTVFFEDPLRTTQPGHASGIRPARKAGAMAL